MKSGKEIKDQLLDLMEKHYSETGDSEIEIWLPNDQWQLLLEHLTLGEIPEGRNLIHFNSPNVYDCEIVRYFGTLTGVRRKGEFAERSLKLMEVLRGIP
ncbi:MAG: hypothetical protein A4S09_05110 [Proteobacteria bacterium SG_bin7]|nr:MAG: hypothetical protein A4S09_05110 [Proteobacteria bacterium SG_bin7]